MIAALLLALAAVQAAPITCKTGPIDHSFGGTEWSVFACSDGRSILARAKPGNPADPFYFIIARRARPMRSMAKAPAKAAVMRL